MALQAFLDSFAISTGAVGTTQPRTGYGFQPKALILFRNASTSAVDAVGGGAADHSIGFATSTTSRRCVSTHHNDASAAGASGCIARNDAINVNCTAAGGVDALLDVDSLDSDGWTSIIDNTYGSAPYGHVLAIGGSDVTNVAIIDFAAATSGATQDVTGVGFPPDSLLILGISTTTSGNAGQTSARLSIGIVGGTTAADNASLNIVSVDGADPTVTRSYCLNGESIVGFTAAPAIDGRGRVSAFGSDGFTITWITNPSAAYQYYVLAIKGGRFAVGDVLTQTDTTTDIVESGLDFSPVAGLLLSACKAASAAGTLDANAEASVGAFTSATTEVASGMQDVDNVATTQTSRGVEFDSSYINISSSDTLDGAMHVTSVDSGGYTARMSNADPAQAFIAHLLFGSAAGGGSTPIGRRIYVMP